MMKKLTAEKCMSVINGLKWMAAEGPGMSIRDEYDIQAYELALKALEQQERACQKCGGTGMADSGGTQPWGEQILVECDCQFEQKEHGDGWIEWRGGECPVDDSTIVDIKHRDGRVAEGEMAGNYIWTHGYYHYLTETAADIIAYRIIPENSDEN